jgi:drug/metabolite transporter (DMT)-like permease
VILDRSKWKENFRSRETILGLLVGFAGVILLFGERLVHSLSGAGATGVDAAAAGGTNWQVVALVVLLLGSISWASGNLFMPSTGRREIPIR